MLPHLSILGAQISALGWDKRVGRVINANGTEGLELGPEGAGEKEHKKETDPGPWAEPEI